MELIALNITIISVGKIKEKYMKDGIDEYGKRLTKYCKLAHVEVNDEKAPENLSENEMDTVKKREGERILRHVKDSMYVITLDINGDMHSSEDFAARLKQLSLSGNSQIVLIIGGSLGLSKDVMERSDEQISFSLMTFPHQLMKLILMEQIYRAFRINRNEPYHK
jgi:23S rRNA (pseudouridine1915-N3)-methyltransferase